MAKNNKVNTEDSEVGEISTPDSTTELVNNIKESADDVNKIKNLPDVRDWCSTGCTVLDLAIANRLPGGVPIGRIIHAFGGGATAKTVCGITVLGYAQRSGKIAHLADIEHTLDTHFASLYGLDCSDEKLILSHPQTLEEMFDDYVGGIIYPDGKKVQKSKKPKMDDKPKVIVIDSVSALPSETELTENMKDGTYGVTRAKQMSKGFRKYIFPLATSNTTLFCIDQTRDNVGQLFGNKEVTSGGRALEFYSSVQVYLKHDSNIVNSKKVTIGVWIKFRIVKNKVAPPFREGRFKILFDYGMDDIGSNLYFLSAQKLGEKEAKNKMTKFELFGESRQLGLWTKYIEDNNLEENLRQEVQKVWKEIYKIEPRKPRVWQ